LGGSRRPTLITKTMKKEYLVPDSKYIELQMQGNVLQKVSGGGKPEDDPHFPW